MLDVLSTYQTKTNKANKTTFSLLEKTLDKIGDLIGNADEVDAATNNDIIVFSVDDRYFEVKRSIFCRVCKVNFGASRTAYMLHSANPEHHRKIIDYENNSKISNGTVLRSDSNNNRNQNGIPEKIESFRGDENEMLEQNQSESVTMKIPDVFGDNLFDFLDSMGKNTSGNKKRNDKPSSTNPIQSWRNREPTQFPLAKQTPQMPTKPALITHSIIQNGAVYTGAGIKPSPTYDLNNLYIKFPYLNPDKVPNPTKPPPLKKSPDYSHTKNNSQSASNQSKDNRRQSSLNGNRTGGISKSSLANSLMSLPTFTNKTVDKTPHNQSSNRQMPGRSSSSISLVGVPKANVSNSQNSAHKQSKSPNDGNRRSENINMNH